jgi:deoxyxylulose-5-phosphate synthase
MFYSCNEICHALTKGSVIAIDGKTVRGSYDKSNKRSVINMVSAFRVVNEVVIGHVKTAYNQMI